MMEWGQFEQNRKKIAATGKCVEDYQGDFNVRFIEKIDISSSLQESKRNSFGFGGLFSRIRMPSIIAGLATVEKVDSSFPPEAFKRQRDAIHHHLKDVIYRDMNEIRQRWGKIQSAPLTEVHTVKGALPMPSAGETILSKQKDQVKELAHKKKNFEEQYASAATTFQKEEQALERSFRKMENQWKRKNTEESERDK